MFLYANFYLDKITGQSIVRYFHPKIRKSLLCFIVVATKTYTSIRQDNDEHMKTIIENSQKKISSHVAMIDAFPQRLQGEGLEYAHALKLLDDPQVEFDTGEQSVSRIIRDNEIRSFQSQSSSKLICFACGNFRFLHLDKLEDHNHHDQRPTGQARVHPGSRAKKRWNIEEYNSAVERVQSQCYIPRRYGSRWARQESRVYAQRHSRAIDRQRES